MEALLAKKKNPLEIDDDCPICLDNKILCRVGAHPSAPSAVPATGNVVISAGAPGAFDPSFQSPGAKFVRFSTLRVPVWHWDKGVKQIVQVELSVSEPYNYFLGELHNIFIDEISGNSIKLYALPCKYTSLDERRLISDDRSLLDTLHLYETVDPKRPLLYVWNHNESKGSPDRLPGEEDGEDAETNVSAFTEESIMCKVSATYTCVICSFQNTAGVGLQGCHIFQREEYKKIKDKLTRIAKLDEFVLSHIHQQNNLICLCTACHPKFDSFELTMHPERKTLLVGVKVRGKQAGNGQMYNELHGRLLVFPGQEHRHPTRQLLQYRYNLFCEKQNEHAEKQSQRKRIKAKDLFFVCCYCTLTFETRDEAQGHELLCGTEKMLING